MIRLLQAEAKGAILLLALAVLAPAGGRPVSPSNQIKPSDLVLAFMINPGETELEGVILADSLRKFGERTAKAEIWAFTPRSIESLGEKTRGRLDGLGVRTLSFAVEDQALDFPLAPKVYAAAEAEARAEGRASILAWLDSDTLILGEPAAWILQAGKILGYRPVMHLLIGSPFDRPLDPFWTLVYDRCGVAEKRVFPMTTPVDEVRIRPYFNAGMLILRPERGILRAWREDFDRLYRDPIFEPFLKDDPRHAVFLHQAILAGTILRLLEPKDLLEIPFPYNYSLQLYGQYPEAKRIRTLDNIVTARYDRLAILREDSAWRKSVLLDESFRVWLDGLIGR